MYLDAVLLTEFNKYLSVTHNIARTVIGHVDITEAADVLVRKMN